MQNVFLKAARHAINTHGKSSLYKSVTASVYDIESGTNTNTKSDFPVMIYKKQINASQYNYPMLIGKESAVFYIANHNLAFVIKVKDKIVYDGIEYSIDSYSEHIAEGSVVMYKVIGVRG